MCEESGVGKLAEVRKGGQEVLEKEARGVRKGGKRCKGIFYNSHELT